VVYCRVSFPYSSLAHPAEGDDSSGASINCNAPRSYVRRDKYVDGIGVGAVVTEQLDDASARHCKDEIHANMYGLPPVTLRGITGKSAMYFRIMWR
jgi:hypothetical protein